MTKKNTATDFLPKPKEQLEQITPRIPTSLKAEVDKAATHLDVSQNKLVEAALRSYLARLREEGRLRGAS